MKHIKTLEFWKDIPGYEGLYQVSNWGKVKRLAGSPKCKQNRILTPRPMANGYLTVNLSKNHKSKSYLIHRLVAMAFLSNEEEFSEVDHINGDRADNRVCNLQWINHIENNRKKSSGIGIPKRVKCVETGEIFESMAAAGKKVNKSRVSISGAIRRNGTCGGYHWEVIE